MPPIYPAPCAPAPTSPSPRPAQAFCRRRDRLNWNALMAAQPKWLLGYSDTSTLALPFTLCLGRAATRGTGLTGLACPVLVDVDIGHRPPQMVLVNGAVAEVRWSRRQGGSVRQVLS